MNMISMIIDEVLDNLHEMTEIKRISLKVIGWRIIKSLQPWYLYFNEVQ